MNNQKFETSICPMCNSILQLRKSHGVNVASCPTTTDLGQPHYEVESDSKQCIQHMYFGEFSIDNFASNSRSRLFKRAPRTGVAVKWGLVTELPMIKADTEENLINRVKKLLPFL